MSMHGTPILPVEHADLRHQRCIGGTWYARSPPTWVGTLYSGPMGLRVHEGGGSAGRAVVVRIGVARSRSGKPGRRPSGRSVREPWVNQLQTAAQMTAAW